MTDPLNQLRVLHSTIDDRVKVLEVEHQDFMQCKRGCSDCCQDDLTVFSIEAQRIEDFLSQSANHRDLQIHPEGSCAFLHPSHKACQVYEVRPYVCRTQGLPLRFIEETDDGLAEFRDICPLNDDPKHPIEELSSESCWEIGPTEGQLWQLAKAGTDSDPIKERVALRVIAERSIETT